MEQLKKEEVLHFLDEFKLCKPALDVILEAECPRAALILETLVLNKGFEFRTRKGDKNEAEITLFRMSKPQQLIAFFKICCPWDKDSEELLLKNGQTNVVLAYLEHFRPRAENEHILIERGCTKLILAYCKRYIFGNSKTEEALLKRGKSKEIMTYITCHDDYLLLDANDYLLMKRNNPAEIEAYIKTRKLSALALNEFAALASESLLSLYLSQHGEKLEFWEKQMISGRI